MNKQIYMVMGLLPITLAHVSAQEKPNVVLIFADDMNFSCMSNVGEDIVYTPNLDQLREKGMYFTHVFNQGGWNGAISAASRAMLNTGKFLWKAKRTVTTKSFKDQCHEQPMLWSQYMAKEGYTTYMSGTGHVPIKTTEVFTVANHERGGMPKQTNEGYAYSEKNPVGRKFIKGQEDTWKPYDTKFGGFWEGGTHWSEVLRDDALSYIDKASKEDKPFFMYLGFNASHDPRQSPKRCVDMYPVDKISVPKNFMPVYPYHEGIGCAKWLRDEMLAPFPRTTYSVQVNRQEYYAIISHMDEQIGRIIDALKRSGKYENTYIIFTADHGLAVGDHGFIGKQNMYDASMRVPMIICGPGIKKGECHDMIYLQDAMATALDIAGSSYLKNVDFNSLLPLAKGKKDKKAVQEYIYGAYIDVQRMVRSTQYKMIMYPKINIVRLYDVQKDPDEMNDLAANPTYKKVADKLLKEFKKLQKTTNDELDVQPCYDRFFKDVALKN